MDERLYQIVDNDEMKLSVDFYLGFPNIHFELPNGASHNKLKFIRDVIKEELFIVLGMNGHEMALAIIPEGDDKLLRFCHFMGFETEVHKDGRIFLAQDIM